MEENNQAVNIQEESIGNLVVQQDNKLVQTIRDTKSTLMSFLEKAEAFNLTKAEDKQTVTDMILQVKAACEPVIDLIKPIKKQANEQIDKLLSVEKVFITYVPPNQAAKTRGDERFIAWKVIDVLTTKLNAYLNHEEAERMKEEARLQVEAERRRQQEMERINKKLNGLLDKVADLNERKKILEDQLNDQSITVEEAEEIRARIDAIEIRLRPTQEKIFDAQTKMEEKAAPVTVSIDKGPKVAGLSSDNFYWDVEMVTNVRIICKQIYEGTLPPACVTVNVAKIKAAGNDQVQGTNQSPNIQGVVFVRKRKISVSSRGRGE